jgi:hypothetical protein
LVAGYGWEWHRRPPVSSLHHSRFRTFLLPPQPSHTGFFPPRQCLARPQQAPLKYWGEVMAALRSPKEMMSLCPPSTATPSSPLASAYRPGGVLLKLSVPQPRCATQYLRHPLPSLPCGGPPSSDMQAAVLPGLRPPPR